MGEGGDLGAYGAEEAVDQGGAAHVRDVGASPEEVRVPRKCEELEDGSGSVPRWGRRRSSRRASASAMATLVGGGGRRILRGFRGQPKGREAEPPSWFRLSVDRSSGKRVRPSFCRPEWRN